MSRVDRNGSGSRSVNTHKSESKPASKSQPSGSSKSTSSSSSKSTTSSKPASSSKPAQDHFDQGSTKSSGPKPTNYVSTKATKNFGSGAQNDIQHYASSSKANVTTNKDGSVTRSSSSTSGQTTRTQELTSSKGPLGQSQLKYATTSKTGGASIKNTYTAQTDLLGHTTASSHDREATYEHGNRTINYKTSESVDTFGIKKNTDAQSKTVTNGENSQTYSKSTTKDSVGNEAWTKDVTHVNKDGNTTVTTTTKKAGGSELTTNSSSKYEDGKLTFNSGADWKSTKSSESSYLKETEHKPSTTDSGFTQKAKDDKLGLVQSGGNMLGAAGLKKEWKYEVPADKMKETNLSKDPNSFVGSRVGYTGSQSLSVGADGVNASFNREAKAGLYAETKGSTTGKYGTASYDAAAKVEAKASIDAKGKLDLNGLDASVNAKVGVSAEASIHGTAETQSIKVGGVDVKAAVDGSAKVSAEATAEATGKVKVTRNPPTAIAEGTVGASAVVKIEGQVKASAGPFSVTASAYASAGAEAKATGVIGYEDGKIKIGGSVGAALGLGAGGSVNAEIDVKQIGDMAKNTAVSVADANHDGKLGLDDAKAVVNNAANTVKSWFHL